MSERSEAEHTRVSPARTDGFIRGLSQLIGGPSGAHAATPGRAQFWTPARVVLGLACLVFVLHWLQKSPCMDGAWVGNIQYKRGCYTDILALYYAEHLNSGMIPYVDWPVEYPVLTGIFMGLLGLPVHALGVKNPALNQAMFFYNANVVVLSIMGVATVGIVLALRRRRPWDAVMLACAPAMLLTATVNWDLLVLFLFAAAMLFWARRKPGWAGLFLGLAVAAKFYPLLFAGPLILLGLRTRRMRKVGVTIGTAALTWVVINGPVWYFWNASWNKFWNLNNTRGIDWGTFWYIGAHFPHGREKYGIPWFQSLGGNVPALNTAYLTLFLVCCFAIALLTLMAPRRPRLAQLAFLVLAAFLMTGKVWSQQYVLWLIPLAVLARPRWGAFLAWQVAEVCYFFAFYGELLGVSGGKQAFPEWVFVLASTGRFATLAVLCGFVVRDILKPDKDVVRQTYADDPDGGVFDGAEDAPWLRHLTRQGSGRKLEGEDEGVAHFPPADSESVGGGGGGLLPRGAADAVA